MGKTLRTNMAAVTRAESTTTCSLNILAGAALCGEDEQDHTIKPSSRRKRRMRETEYITYTHDAREAEPEHLQPMQGQDEHQIRRRGAHHTNLFALILSKPLHQCHPLQNVYKSQRSGGTQDPQGSIHRRGPRLSTHLQVLPQQGILLPEFILRIRWTCHHVLQCH